MTQTNLVYFVAGLFVSAVIAFVSLRRANAALAKLIVERLVSMAVDWHRLEQPHSELHLLWRKVAEEVPTNVVILHPRPEHAIAIVSPGRKPFSRKYCVVSVVDRGPGKAWEIETLDLYGDITDLLERSK